LVVKDLGPPVKTSHARDDLSKLNEVHLEPLTVVVKQLMAHVVNVALLMVFERRPPVPVPHNADPLGVNSGEKGMVWPAQVEIEIPKRTAIILSKYISLTKTARWSDLRHVVDLLSESTGCSSANNGTSGSEGMASDQLNL